MTPSVAVITSTYPPDPCGVGDYTYQLSRALGAACDVTVVTNRRKGIPPPEVPVKQLFDRYRARTLFDTLPELERIRPDWVLLQYDPYSYGTPHSFNPYLPALMQLIRWRLPQTRIAAVVHETFVAPSNVRRAIMTSWQRAQLWALGRSSDLLVFVVNAWAKRLAGWFPGATVMHLPVGNNVPTVAVDRATLRAELGLPSDGFILGWLGRGLEYQPDWLGESIRAAETAGARPFAVHVGVGGDYARSALNGTPSKITGLVTTEEVSRHLSAFDLYLAPIAEGLSSRRTSVIAALAHRVPVVASVGSATEAIFRNENGRSLVLVDPARGETFADAVTRLAQSAELRAALGREGERFAREHFSWESIGARLIERLAEPHRRTS